MTLDAFDRKILALLQADGRISLTDLAERVGLSLSPCHRRVRRMEREGILRGYRADVSARAVGLEFASIVSVTLKDSDRDKVLAFEAALPRIDEIVDAQRLFGDPDYILRVVTRDLQSFQRIYDERLLALPNVSRLTSAPVMKEILRNRGLILSPDVG